MQENVLLMLRDIHQPAAIAWWPPAIGWWALLSVLLFGLLMAWWRFWPQWLRYQKRKKWLATFVRLQQQAAHPKQAHKALMNVSKLLRKIAHKRFPEQAAGQLLGQDWLRFLNETSGEAIFQGEIGKALTVGPYSPHCRLSEADRKKLFQGVIAWVEKYV